MKTTIVKNTKNYFIAFAASMLLLASTNVIASSKLPDTTGKDVSVQYLGTRYDQPLFQLNVPNESGADLIISLENMNGETLYTYKLTGSLFSKRILLATTETNISLNLKVYSVKTKQTQVYEINKTTQVHDDVVINQVKY